MSRAYNTRNGKAVGSYTDSRNALPILPRPLGANLSVRSSMPTPPLSKCLDTSRAAHSLIYEIIEEKIDTVI